MNLETNSISYSEILTSLANTLQLARDKTNADAGTIYLIENDVLTCVLAQNDTLFPQSEHHKFYYLNTRLPLDTSSIAGYVATSGNYLNIPNVYKIDSSTPFSFNPEMDKTTGYKTESTLTIPLAHEKQILGVLQLINRKQNGKIQRFTENMKQKIQDLCYITTSQLKQSLLFTNQELRRRLLIYETLLDAVPNPIFAKNGDGYFKFFNKAYEHFFGINRKELLEKSMPDHNTLPTKDHNRNKNKKSIDDNQAVHYETAYTTKHGQRNTLYWEKSITFATGEKALIGELVDISHLKKSEKELAAKIEKLTAEQKRLTNLYNDYTSQSNNSTSKETEKAPINLESYNTFLARIEDLSRAELRLFNLYIQGKTSHEAADILQVSINTIRTHNQHIFAKFGVTSKKELMVYIGMMG